MLLHTLFLTVLSQHFKDLFLHPRNDTDCLLTRGREGEGGEGGGGRGGRKEEEMSK